MSIIFLLSLLLHGDENTSCVHASSFNVNVGDEFDSQQNSHKEEISVSSKRSQHQDSSYHDSVDEFYSFSLDDTSLMAALFPDMKRLRLRDAWEVHPLLSKVSFNTNTQTKPVPFYTNYISQSIIYIAIQWACHRYRSTHVTPFSKGYPPSHTTSFTSPHRL